MYFLNKIEKMFEENNYKKKNKSDWSNKISFKKGYMIGFQSNEQYFKKNNPYFKIFKSQMYYFLKFFFTKICNLVMILFSIIISLLNYDYTFYRGDIYIYFFIIIIFLNFLIEYFWSLKIFNFKKTIGHKKYQIVNSDRKKDINGKIKVFLEKEKENIKIGNILKLNFNEEAPCNLLLLASDQIIKGDYYGIINNSSNNESINLVKIKAVQLTKQNDCNLNAVINLKNWIEKFDFKLEFKLNENKNWSFKAKIKAKNDPKPEYCDLKNLIPKGSVLKSKWIYGICLDSCKNNYFIQKKEKTYTKKIKLIEFYSLKWFIISILTSFFQFLILIIINNLSLYLSIFDNKINNGLRIISILILYIPFLPFGLYFGIDILNYFYSNKIEKNYNKNKNDFLKIINKDTLLNLGKINQVCLSKTSILSKNKLIIDNIFINNNIYKIDQYKFLETIESSKIASKKIINFDEDIEIKVRNKTNSVNNLLKSDRYKSILNKDIKTFKESKNSVGFDFKKSDTYWKNKNYNKMKNKKKSIVKLGNIKINEEFIVKDLEDFKDDFKSNIYLKDLIRSFLLCNNLNIKSNHENNFVEIDDIFEKCQLKLSNLVNYKLYLKIPQIDNEIIYKIQLKLNDEIEYYDILFYNFSKDINKEIYTVIVKDENSNYILYSRMNPQIANKIIKFEPENFEHFNKTWNFNYDKGFTSFVYGKKFLKNEEIINLIEKCKNIKNSFLNKDDLSKELAKEIEFDLEFISIIGFKEIINEDAYNLIDEFKKNNIQINLLTSDNYLNALQIVNNFNIINNDENSFFLNFNDENSGKTSIKNCFEELKKYKDLLLKDEKLKSSKIVFNEFLENSINNKDWTNENFDKFKKELKIESKMKKLTKFNLVISGESISIIIKNSFIYNHFIFILNFCKTIIGFNMTNQEKGILTEIIKKNSELNSVLAIGSGDRDNFMMKCSDISVQYSSNVDKIKGDIILNKLDILKKLIYTNSVNLNKNLNNFIFHSIFMNLLFWFSTVIFQLFFYFSGISIFHSYLLIISNILMNIVLLIIFCLGEDYYGKHLRNKYSSIYNENKHLNNLLNKNYYLTIIEAFIISLIDCFILVNFGFKIIKNGLNINYHSFNFLLFIIIFITSHLRVFIYSKKIKIRMFFLIFGNFLLLIKFIKIFEFFTKNLILVYFYEILKYDELLYLAVFILLINYLIIEFNFLFFYIKTEFPLYNIIKSFINKKTLNVLSDSFLLNNLNKIKSVSQYFINKFNKNFYYSSLIDKLIDCFDLVDNKDYINNLTLKYNNINLENKFINYNKNLNKDKWLNILFFISVFLCELFSIINSQNFKNINIIINLLIPILIFLFNLLKSIKIMKNRLNILFPIYWIIILIIKFFNILLTNNYSLLFSFIFSFYLLSLKNINFTTYLVLQILDFLLIELLFYSNNKFLKFFKSINLFYSLIVLSINLLIKLLFIFFKYFLIKFRKEKFMKKQKLNIDSTNSNEILSLLMPKFVIDKLGGKLGNYFESEISDNVGELTVLFCDIVDFDEILNLYGNEIVKLLDFIFRKFDKLCNKYGIQKIETVGKTYMAAAGIKFIEEKLNNKFKNIDNTKRIIDLAKDMLIASNQIILKNDKKLSIKIGIHYGECMMGIIGYHKPQFSLIGDTINFTSRHCSTGLSNEIMISKNAYSRIKDYDILEKNKFTLKEINTPMKGKGGEKSPVLVYHIFLGKKNLFKKKLNSIIENNKDKFNNVINEKEMEKLINLDNVIKNKKLKTYNISKFSILLDKIKENNLIEKNKIIENKKQVLKKKLFESRSGSLIFDDHQINLFDYDKIEYEGYFLKIVNKINNKNLIIDIKKNIKTFNFTNIKLCLIIYSIFFMIITFLLILNISNIFIISSRVIIFILLYVLIIKNFIFKNYYNILNLLNIIQFLSLYIIFKNREINLVFYFLFIEMIVGLLISSQAILLNLNNYIKIYLFFYNFLIIISIFIINKTQNNALSKILEVTIFLIFVNYCIYLVKYHKIKLFIKISNQINTNKLKNNKIEKFVDRLLPKHIQENISNKKGKLGEKYKNVTILFADIVGFTNYSSGKQPKEVVKMLSELFKDFDKACNKKDLFKVYTIGDCYVVMSFLDKNNRKSYSEEAIDVIRLGLKFIEIIDNVRNKIKYYGLNMRIGIHTGDIIGGVIGTDVVRFDIYGKNVNIANKMESNGENDKVMISEDTLNLIENSEDISNFNIKFNKEIDIDSKSRKIKSYFINKKK